jgi:DNA adenine methylase
MNAQPAVKRRRLSPVLRWAGGKRWLIPKMEKILDGYPPSEYIEPFVGGASVFLAFEWPRAAISDVNMDLIATYRGLAADAERVRKRLSELPVSRSTYADMRDWACTTDTDRAVRLLYLNRCAYAGIYRTNRAGKYNVPFSGDRDLRPLVQTDSLLRVGTALRSATISAADFERVLEPVQSGAVVYCDPAYALPGSESHFRRYSPTAFNWTDQRRLAEAAQELRRRGVCVLVSNSADPRVSALFRGGVTLRFQRRAAFPRSNGRTLDEALYILADRNSLRRIKRRLTDG